MSLLTKILIIAVVAYLAWTFLRKSNILRGARKTTDVPPKGRPMERTIEDMVKCPKCGAYVPEKGGHDCLGA
jgi:hypothetical protein